jgi:hypothetical protein
MTVCLLRCRSPKLALRDISLLRNDEVAFGGEADMVALMAGSAWSRMTLKRHARPASLRRKNILLWFRW